MLNESEFLHFMASKPSSSLLSSSTFAPTFAVASSSLASLESIAITSTAAVLAVWDANETWFEWNLPKPGRRRHCHQRMQVKEFWMGIVSKWLEWSKLIQHMMTNMKPTAIIRPFLRWVTKQVKSLVARLNVGCNVFLCSHFERRFS